MTSNSQQVTERAAISGRRVTMERRKQRTMEMLNLTM
ncbi:uncharacterized protein G2W53_016292 [Senna tora]|uniref:Uncharacterized protein n=1 Tax=Senna tora TaxID=362788 RepID=A0A834TMP2_9FABA|nr:uncharacterized protein G2W53_016292 [Senna tora]